MKAGKNKELENWEKDTYFYLRFIEMKEVVSAVTILKEEKI